MLSQRVAGVKAAEFWRFGPKAFKMLYNVRDPAEIQRRAEASTPFEQVVKGWPISTDPGPHLEKIHKLQESGVMFCVCDAALTVFTGMVAMQTKGNAADIKKEWIDGLMPGFQVVPSGVWAVGRAQEHGCAYCFVG